ncbi:MAG: hypothetical protein ACI97K_002486 [Glaciecola sp.]|jgi:hypothetical protein
MIDHDKPTGSNLKSNPYPGLRPFQFEESHLFFGRDEQRNELLNRLRDSRFLAVVGTSGSGKSSLVRAGLLPGLLAGFMDRAGTRWRIADTRPGGDPIGRLAEALDKKGVLSDEVQDEGELSFTETNLRRSAQGLVTAVKEAQLPKNQRLLVLVDQFEELFRFVDETSHNKDATNDASAFVKLLLTAASQTEVPIYVVLTMRTDFLGDCARFRDLPEAINDGQYLIPRLTRSQRREAIDGPAAMRNVELSRILINRLLNDVGDIPDQLPILQHALMRTWEVSIKKELDCTKIMLADYIAVGGMEHALSRHAESIYDGLAEGVDEKEGKKRQLIAEKMFKCLTEESDISLQIRRLATLEEISHVVKADIDDVIDVIDQFRQQKSSFLMPPIGEELLPESFIDISHESLIRNWTTLEQWAHEEAMSADTYQRLAHAARLYNNDKDELLVGRRLRMALEWEILQQPNEAWALRYDPDYSIAMEFLDKSEIKRLAEEERFFNKKRVKRTFGIGLFAAMIVGFLFFVLGNIEILIEHEKLRKADNTLVSALTLMHKHIDVDGSKEDRNYVPDEANFSKINIELVVLMYSGPEGHKALAHSLIEAFEKREPPTDKETLLFNLMSDTKNSALNKRKNSFKELKTTFEGSLHFQFAKEYSDRELQPTKSIYDAVALKWEDQHKSVKDVGQFLVDISAYLIIGLSLPLLRWFSLRRWRRRKKLSNKGTGKANPIWRVFAELSDLAIAGALGTLAGVIVAMTSYTIEGYRTLSDVNSDEGWMLGTVAGILVMIIYLLLRDNLKFRFRRSPGKILFGLCPMTLSEEGFTLKTSLKYNSLLFVYIGLVLVVAYISLDSSLVSLDFTLSAVFVFVIIFWLIWLILALKGLGRTLGDRFVGVRIVDIRSEQARLLRFNNIASLSGRKTHFYRSLASKEPDSDESKGAPVEVNSAMDGLDDDIQLDKNN